MKEVGIIFLMMFGVPLLMAPPGWLVYQYMRHLFELVKRLETQQPFQWQQLGSPRGSTFTIHGFGRSGGCCYYQITPFMPLFRWLRRGLFHNLDSVTSQLAVKTRFYMVTSFVAVLALFAVAAVFIYLVEFS